MEANAVVLLYFLLMKQTWPSTFMEMTSVGPCIVLYFYSKTKQMDNISNIFYFGNYTLHDKLSSGFSPFHLARCHIRFIKNQLMHLFQKTLFYIHIKNTKNLLKNVL
jgi:hypothetical protein